MSITVWDQRMEQACQRLQQVPGAHQLISEMRDLQQRMRDRRRFISVFGAFSAGKSSLINGLLEDQALVVSPNPTTASITQIRGADSGEGTPHRATVYIKSSDEVYEDVRDAISAIHREAADLPSALRLAQALKVTEVPSAARRSLMYLKAVASGYEAMTDRLGTALDLSWEEAKQFTADERMACFVKRVDLVHPASFLTSGLSLVDTPGVDSVNQRHTHVAFDYMRKADAVVFVIYYTHAFSRADKDFLLQLSGVQDVVGQDKLFVVINAVDLATSSNERQAVRERVELELRHFGLRQARVFEVSSQLAYAARQLASGNRDPQIEALLRQRLRLNADDPLPTANEIANQAGLDAFKSSVLEFVQSEAERSLIDAAVRLWQTTTEWLDARLTWLRQQADASAETKAVLREKQQEKLQQLEGIAATEADAAMAGDGPWTTPMQNRLAIQAEVAELTFHATQRIRFRLGELVREAFHPGRFIQAGRAKQQLQDAAEELSGWLMRQWLAEARTLALRAGVSTNQLLKRFVASWRSELQQVGFQDVQVPTGWDENGVQDRLVAGLSEVPLLDWHVFEAGFAHFSSAKQFFEGGGQKAMIAECEGFIEPWLTRVRESLVADMASKVGHLTVHELLNWSHATAATLRGEISASTGEVPNVDMDTVEAQQIWFVQHLGDMQES